MKNKLLFLCLFPLLAQAMDVGSLLRRINEEIEQEQVPAGSVMLVSNKGTEFSIPQNIAEQSKTLEFMISDMGTDRKILLNAISSQTLEEIINLLKSLYNHQDLRDKKLLDVLEQEVKISDPFALLAAANYLDIQPILELAARATARQELAKRKRWLATVIQGPLSKEAHTKLFTTFGQSKKDMLALIARYFFLLSGKKLTDVPQDSYGFSIQDYLDYNFAPLKSGGVSTAEKWGSPVIFYNKKSIVADRFDNLNSIYGLQNIADTDKNHLSFENFKFLTIKENFFNGLNLNKFTITRSCINAIPIEALKKLTALQYLTLSENHINLIPAGISELNSLIWLDLDENNITNIPKELSALNKLELLSLRENRIITIDQETINALAQMPFLRYLDLAHNPINLTTKQELRRALGNRVIFYDE
jgi:hypothetical protein